MHISWLEILTQRVIMVLVSKRSIPMSGSIMATYFPGVALNKVTPGERGGAQSRAEKPCLHTSQRASLL